MAERAAIVTGASSGIGLAIARILGEEGYGITMAARRAEKLQGAVAGLEADGFDVHGVAANVADESEIQKVVAAHRERYGRLDVLVNNAGVGVGSTVGEIETKRLDMQLDINIRSIVLFYRECVSMLLEAGAQHKNALVVNTSSISGKRAEGWLSVYSATKHAVVGWTEAMNKEIGTQGVKSTRAVPGVRRHADDRLRQGPGGGGGDDPSRGHRRVRALPAAHLAGMRRARDHVHQARRLAVATLSGVRGGRRGRLARLGHGGLRLAAPAGKAQAPGANDTGRIAGIGDP